MPQIKINHRVLQAEAGATILATARAAGIDIPTLCWMKEFRPSTSCMVCVVQDLRNGKILTSCSAVVEEGMDISTDNEEVLDMRKSALELLLSEHYGDCEAPCQRVCPAEMDIPNMNRLIAAGRLAEALRLVKETIALPAVLGYICPAPCEKACRRKDVDEAVSICLLKRFVAENDLREAEPYAPSLLPSRGVRVAIVGAGPAGLAAAYYLARQGFDCHVYDAGAQPGGKLRTDLSAEKLPVEVLDAEIEAIRQLGVVFFQNQTVSAESLAREFPLNYPFVLWTAGAGVELNTSLFAETPDSSHKELLVFKAGDTRIFVPRQIPSKSKMAVRAVGLGRKLSEWLTEYVEKGWVAAPAKAFNSVYKTISALEEVEFLKEASNASGRMSTPSHRQGFSLEQARLEAERCLHCDCRKKDCCGLRDLSTAYKASQRVYTLDVPKLVTKNTEHDQIVFEPLKCIKCGICIQTALLEGDRTGFAFHGRGFDVRIAIPIQRSVRELSDPTVVRCAKNCPTGAISMKREERL